MKQSAVDNSPNQLIGCRRFHDIDELSVVLNCRRKLKLTHLSTQPFQADLLVASFDEAQFLFGTASCSVYSIGEKNVAYLDFSCVLQPTGPGIVSHKYKLSHNTLFGFDTNRETSIVVPPNLQLGTVQIRRDVFEDCLQAMDRPDIDPHFLATNYLCIPATLPTVKAYLIDLLNLIRQQPHFLKLPQLKKLILEDFIPLLIDAIPSSSESLKKSRSLLSQVELVKRTEDYMMAHLDRPLTLKELCQALNTSRSLLFSGFQGVVGVSPMVYLKIQRLHGVRRSLKLADPETISIMSLAHQFGFWSAGHFARDYKQMFGELPSETIKQSLLSGEDRE